MNIEHCARAKRDASEGQNRKAGHEGEGFAFGKAATARSGPIWGFAPAPKGRRTGEAEEKGHWPGAANDFPARLCALRARRALLRPAGASPPWASVAAPPRPKGRDFMQVVLEGGL